MPLNRSLIAAHELGQAGLCKSRHVGIIVGWQATYGRPNILAVPIAGCLTPRQGRNIQTSILEVSAVRFVRPRSTRGRAIMNFLIGKSIRRSRLSLGRGGGDQQASSSAGRSPTCGILKNGPTESWHDPIWRHGGDLVPPSPEPDPVEARRGLLVREGSACCAEPSRRARVQPQTGKTRMGDVGS